MAGNDVIHFLRGTSTIREAKSDILGKGQPFYETDTNKLYIGDDIKAINNLKPVGNNIRTYWENIENIHVTVGDRSFIELNDGTILPALCVDTECTYSDQDNDIQITSNSSTWQVSWYEKETIASSAQLKLATRIPWGATDVKIKLNRINSNNLPKYLQDKIIPVTKTSGDGDKGVSCTLWSPSVEEIFGLTTGGNAWVAISKDTQFRYYNYLLGDNINATDPHSALSSNSVYWLRNRPTNNNSWSALGPLGGVITPSVKSNTTLFVSFCFKV